jgi:hypothetical protein
MGIYPDLGFFTKKPKKKFNHSEPRTATAAIAVITCYYYLTKRFLTVFFINSSVYM